MRRLTLALDALPALRDATRAPGAGLAAAATVAELAGVHALRLGISDELSPVTESDVVELRRAARVLELRMPPSQGLQKVALEARPDCVVLCSGGAEGVGSAQPFDVRGAGTGLTPWLRSLEEAGIPVVALVPPGLDGVKAAHGLGVAGVEFYTGSTIDLPAAERRAQLDSLGDSVRLASKLRLEIGVGGGLGFHSVTEVLEAAPAADRVVAGRELLSRAVLVGLDRSLRDFEALIG
ncbi:MAG: pyridoxine 5'-phosphate synthase [Myxococcota bacterium]